ncbi:hypothetical protein BASA82_000248 [Batrachochytrium salamandrivorans]|nr:hypothetical protein BASA82_000248 [Batrachochytrium salamandrivorans]
MVAPPLSGVVVVGMGRGYQNCLVFYSTRPGLHRGDVGSRAHYAFWDLRSSQSTLSYKSLAGYSYKVVKSAGKYNPKLLQGHTACQDTFEQLPATTAPNTCEQDASFDTLEVGSSGGSSG